MPYINQWAKTDSAIRIIESQKPFCLEGVLYQGYNQTIVRVKESQLTDREMSEVNDIDGTMETVWTTRRQRLEGRNQYKIREYEERRATLRARRNEILTSIERQQKAGLNPSPGDLDDIARIDKRMARLVDLEREGSLAVAERKTDEYKRTHTDSTGEPRVECQYCHEFSPAGHDKPKKWLTGHRMSCKARPGSEKARRGRPRKVKADDDTGSARPGVV